MNPEEGAYLMQRIKARCTEDGDCLIWNGWVAGGSSPMIRLGGSMNKPVPVRRVVLQFIGKWKEGMNASNKCGNTRCVAEEHVEAKTNQKLGRDKSRMSGYHLNPVRNAKIAAAAMKRGKLTEEVRAQIKESESELTYRQMADLHGVSASAIGGFLRGESYKDYSNPFGGLFR